MKTKNFLAVAALMLSVCLVSAAPQGPKGKAQKKQQTYFVDENGDGICDNYGTKVSTFFIDLNGDGICDNCKNPDCTSFVDANGDGKCDNCTSTCTGTKPKDGTGKQQGKGKK